MAQQGVRTGLRSRALGVLSVCCVAAVAVTYAADCRLVEMNVPDPEAMSLKDGEHVIASVASRGGKIEARVVVKGNTISANQYYLAGKPMRTTPQEKIPTDIRECLGIKKAAATVAPNWLASAALALRDWVEPPLDARVRCTVKCTCNQNTCCCLANCGGSTGVGCSGF